MTDKNPPPLARPDLDNTVPINLNVDGPERPEQGLSDRVPKAQTDRSSSGDDDETARELFRQIWLASGGPKVNLAPLTKTGVLIATRQDDRTEISSVAMQGLSRLCQHIARQRRRVREHEDALEKLRAQEEEARLRQEFREEALARIRELRGTESNVLLGETAAPDQTVALAPRTEEDDEARNEATESDSRPEEELTAPVPVLRAAPASVEPPQAADLSTDRNTLLGLPPHQSFERFDFPNKVAIVENAIRKYRSAPPIAASLLAREVGILLSEPTGDKGTGERNTDAFVHLYRPLADERALSERVLPVLAGLRRDLGGALVDGAGMPLDEIMSLTALGTLSSIVSEHAQIGEAELLSIVYYHEALQAITALDETTRAKEMGKIAPTIQTSANNLAASIARLRSGRTDAVSAQYAPLIRSLSNITVAVTRPASESGTKFFEETADALELPGEIVLDSGERFTRVEWLERLSASLMVSSPYEHNDDGRLQIAWRYAVVGMTRCASPRKTRGSGPASLFNSGVELLRRDDQMEKAPLLRAILNSAGAFAALRISDDLREAMIANDGGDCIVNLFGSLVDLIRTSRNTFPEREVGAIIALRPTFEEFLEWPDRRRLQSSILLLQEQEGLEKVAAQAGELEESLIRLLRAFGGQLDVVVPPRLDIPQLAELVRAGFLHQGEQEGLPPSWLNAHLTEFLPGLLSMLGDPLETLRKLYDDDSLGLRERGPLVVGGLRTEEEWEDIVASAVARDDSRPIADILAAAYGDLANSRDAAQSSHDDLLAQIAAEDPRLARLLAADPTLLQAFRESQIL